MRKGWASPRSSLMTESTHDLLKWAFEGVGGAALVGLIGWLWHVVTRKPEATPPDLRSKQAANAVGGNANISESHSAGVEAGSTLQNSPVIAGSNNTVHYHHKTNADADDLGWVGGLVVFLILVAALCGVFYFVLRDTHAETPAIRPSPALEAGPKTELGGSRRSPRVENAETGPPASTPKARTEVGLAFSDRLGSSGFGVFESESCVTAGVTCLGEGKIKDKTITVPLQHGTNWQRIVVLVSTFDTGEFDLDNPHVVVSTTSADVGLSYASHRDGESRKRLEFTDELFPTTKFNRPDSFTLDIELGPGVEQFPLEVEVWAKGLRHHIVSFTVHAAGGPA